MKRVALIVGTRPNFVKAAPVTAAFKDAGGEVVLVHTGQHFDEALSDSFFRRLGLPTPDHHLGVGKGSRGEQTGEIIRGLAAVFPKLKVDAVVVVGDVTSTSAAAVAADACDLPVVHVEAGLRSFDLGMPEERNRLVADALARVHFVTERSGRENLLCEGRPESGIHLVGNVMIDTLLRFQAEALAATPWRAHGVDERGYVVATLHRPSNVDRPEALRESLELLGLAAARLGPVLFATHPRTLARLGEFGLSVPVGVRSLPPLPYFDFIGLMGRARAVMTDSGGAQEETALLDVPCLTLRENTERPITCELGTSRIVGRSRERITRAIEDILAERYEHARPIPFWDGRAGERIAAILRRL